MHPVGRIHPTWSPWGRGPHLPSCGIDSGFGLVFGGALATSSLPIPLRRVSARTLERFLLSSPSSIFIFLGSDSSRALGVEIKVEGARAKSTCFALPSPPPPLSLARSRVCACVRVLVSQHRRELRKPGLIVTCFVAQGPPPFLSPPHPRVTCSSCAHAVLAGGQRWAGN